MSKERYKSNVAVFLMLTRINNNKEEILLHKRQNTGYMDDKYDMSCSGHLEPNESIITAIVREAKEEIGIIIKEEDIKLLTVVHDYEENYMRFFFTTSKYIGVPTIKEPEKCSELVWKDINDLPAETVFHIRLVIGNIKKGILCDDGFFTYSNNA